MIELNGNKVLMRMVKRGSPQSVVIFEDQDDNFMIHVMKVMTRTGEELRDSLIIRPDLDQWISYYISNGFEISDPAPVSDVKTELCRGRKLK